MAKQTHVAILEKTGQIMTLILEGKKTIESRWSKNRIAPYKKAKPGDIIYFKLSGGPIKAKAKISKVMYLELNDKTINQIIQKYGKQICIKKNNPFSKGKKYCSLIWITNIQETILFHINKKGFGNACAWLIVNNIETIKKNNHH